MASSFDRHSYRAVTDVSEIDHIPDLVASRKYDGAAYVMNIDGNGNPRFVSRSLDKNNQELDRTDKVPHLGGMKIPGFRNRAFHVELIHSGFTKNDPESHPAVSGILNSLAPKALKTQRDTGPLRAVLLDEIGSSHKTYGDKLEDLKALAYEAGNPDMLFVPETKITSKGVQELLEHTRKNNLEGVIATSTSLPEDVTNGNHRYKFKNINTYNLRVVDLVEEKSHSDGSGKNSAGALVLADSTGRVVGKVGTGFSREQRKEIYRNPHNWVDRVINVKALPPTASQLRAPVYNGDADGELDTVTAHNGR